MSILGRALQRFYPGLEIFSGIRLAPFGAAKTADTSRRTFTWGTANPPTHSEVNGSWYGCLAVTDPRDLFWVRISGAWVRAFPASSLVWYGGTVSAPAADSAAGVHASNGDDIQTWPGPFTNPVVPRNISITFGSAWAGGNVTITGTNQFDAPLSETIVASAGAKVEGVKAFKTVTAISHAAAGPGGLNHGATAGWGHKFGIAKTLALALGVLTEDGNQDAATWDSTYHAFTPTQLPNASRTYRWAVPT